MNKRDYVKATKHMVLSVGDSVRIARELQEVSQNELAALSKIPQATISAIENGHVNLGVERAKKLAKVLKVHPSVLVFPDWEIEVGKTG